MGKKEVEYVDRNKRMYELWCAGKYASYAAMGRKYQLSRERIRRIILIQEKKNGRRRNNNGNPS